MKLFNLKYLPLSIVVGFNLFTLFIFYTAPIRWVTNNLSFFLFFSLFCQVTIILGFRIGYVRSMNKDVSDRFLHKLSPGTINFMFIIYPFSALIKYAYFLKINMLDIKGMVDFLMIGILNPQVGYALSLDESRQTSINWYIYFLISFVNQVFFIIGFIKWGELNRVKKVFLILFVFVELFYWMGRGTNFGVISMITTLTFASILTSKKLSIKKALRLYIGIILFLIVSINIFSYNMNSRAGNVKLDFQYFNLGLSQVNENAAVFSIIPKEFHQNYLYIVSYLTQGYYHTCLAFDLDFKSTFFLGNNPALIELAKVFGFDVWKDTYMYRLKEKGVDPLMRWHSAYAWYASDVSFFGVPLILFFLGYFFGSSWAFSLNRNDFLSKILFVIFGNMLIFLFANNSYLASVFYSLMYLLPMWYFTRIKRFKIKFDN